MSKYRTIQMRDWISRPFKLFKLLTLTSETINSIVKIIYIFTHSNNKIGYEKKKLPLSVVFDYICISETLWENAKHVSQKKNESQ